MGDRATRKLIVAALVLAMGCDDKKTPPSNPEPPPPTPMPSTLAVLGMDASVLSDPIDPPPPAGDLKSELDRFVNVDTCVTERAKLDPLVGDALGAIGYETFLRDACRLLEAAKDRKRETCDRIDSSALRSRCQSWVAMIAQTPEQCPMQFEGLVTRGRQASCLAIAAKDPRLCVGEARTVQRATCEALVAQDPSKCAQLLPAHRALCEREVARWRTVLAPPLEGLPKLPTPRAKLVVHGAAGATNPADTPSVDVDLTADFIRGVVVVTGRESSMSNIPPRARIELGTVVESEAARIAASPQKRARIGLAVVAELGKTEKATVQKLELELPGAAPIISPPASCDCRLTKFHAATERGGEVAIVLDGTVSGAGQSYKVTLDLVTFARDVISEGAGQSRVLPPIHPTLGQARPLVGDGGLR